MLHEYKCPCCDGTIAFDSSLQKMKCPFCLTEFDAESLKQYDDVLKEDEKAQDNVNWDTKGEEDWYGDGMKHYVCTACAGEIIGDQTLAATKCPYCGNAVIVMEHFKGMLKPDTVVPFKKSKEEAIEIFRSFMSKKPLLPKEFSAESRLSEVKGVYVPVWLFDAGADGVATYNARRVRTWSDSKFRYTQTSFYKLRRRGRLNFVRIPVDGSEKMPDELMESIQPYDMSEAKDFQTAYLSGYLADRYDVPAVQAGSRAVEKAKGSLDQYLRNTVHGYSMVTTASQSINVHNGKESYTLLPVWLLQVDWNGGNYHFAVNAQTGRIAGDLPVSRKRWWKWFLIIWASFAAGLSLVLTGIYFLLG